MFVCLYKVNIFIGYCIFILFMIVILYEVEYYSYDNRNINEIKDMFWFFLLLNIKCIY